MQFQARQKYLNALTQRMIPFSQAKINEFKIKNHEGTSNSQRGLECMILPIGLPRFSDEHTIRIIQDHKSLSRLETGLRVTL